MKLESLLKKQNLSEEISKFCEKTILKLKFSKEY